jgi:hypothetical protein
MSEVSQKKNYIVLAVVVLIMAGIIALWFMFEPPQYFKKDKTDRGVFDSIKGQFSNIFSE